MIDRTRYAIAIKPEFTATGYPEIVATFVMKKTAVAVLKHLVPDAKLRRDFIVIRHH